MGTVSNMNKKRIYSKEQVYFNYEEDLSNPDKKIICTKCSQEKHVSFYQKRPNRNKGYYSSCRECKAKQRRKDVKTKKGLIYKIYNRQQRTCRNSDIYPPPKYTLEEFTNWMYSQDNFEKLYTDWVKSGYIRNLTPSVDRLEETLGYFFGNIQLITWGENHARQCRRKKQGLNPKNCLTIYYYDKDLNLIEEFPSMTMAQKSTGRCMGTIIKSCKNKTLTKKKKYFSYEKLH